MCAKKIILIWNLGPVPMTPWDLHTPLHVDPEGGITRYTSDPVGQTAPVSDPIVRFLGGEVKGLRTAQEDDSFALGSDWQLAARIQ